MPTIAYFVSSHGYGHATRSSAIISAIQHHNPHIRFEIFTKIPHWLFAESITQPFGYHEILTDIGIAQQDSLTEDLSETYHRLSQFMPFKPSLLQSLAQQLATLNCCLVMCDIAPLGIAVAQQAGIPSVLIENFTWDWIYEGYLSVEPRLAEQVTYLRTLFQTADYHVQTKPVCLPQSTSLTTWPVSRLPKSQPEQLRKQLAIPTSAKLVLITMGGVPWEHRFLHYLEDQPNIYFIIAGQAENERRGHLLLLDKASGIYHPDLITACDAVIGKVGYSTLAEVYQAGVPFGYIPRQRFRESPILTSFIESHMSGLPLTSIELSNGQWLKKLPQLLDLSHHPKPTIAGADQVAQFIIELLT